MKNIKIVGIAALAAVFLVGCGEKSVGETSKSSVESTTSSSSSVESLVKSEESEPNSTSGGQNSSSSEVADNQDIIKSNSTATPDPDTSTDVSTSEPDSTSDTHEPTSEPTSSSSSSSGGTSSSSSSSSTTSKPTSSSSSSGGNTSSSSSSQPSSSSTSYVTAPTSKYWNPNAPGNTPGPYGGYYDASGKLHAIEANVPRDSSGYPVVTFEDEYGIGHMTKADKEAWDAETDRIANGGKVDDNLTEDEWKELWGW